LTPSAVVTEARDPEHPWHSEFVWANGLAADKYRLEQARRLIAQVRITVQQGNVTTASVAYVHAPSEPAQGYISVTEVGDDRAMAVSIVTAELLRVQSVLLRARELAAMLDLNAQVDALLRGPEGLMRIVEMDADEIADALRT
jgi:hypothetical protein